jgi:hypothetical protein
LEGWDAPDGSPSGGAHGDVLNLLHRWESAELNQEKGAELLGDVPTFPRWTLAHEEAGEAGLLDRRLGRAAGKRVPTDRGEEVERLCRERYQGASTSIW